MADISKVSRLLAGVQRQVDLSANTLVVGSIKVGTVSPTELTKTILDRLVSLQNGTDVDATYHTHDGRYFTETELGSASGTTGSDLIGDDDSYSNFTPSAATVKGALSGIDAALAGVGGSEFADNLFRVTDDGDNTKKIAFQASGITTGTTRTITMPDANVNLADVNNAVLVDGSRAFTADQSMGGNQLTNVGAPSVGSDAATKSYVDSVAEGLKPKQAVRVASVADVDISSELENGDVIDGITLATGDRVLLKDQTDDTENGIYVVVASGAASRSSDFDSLTPVDEINGAYVPVQEGTANAGKLFVQSGTVTAIGTDPIVFIFFNSISGLVGGDGITISGSNVSVDHDGEGLTFVATQLALELDGSTLSKSSSGVKVADNGITGTQLNSSVAGAGLTGGGGSALAVGAGDGITVNANDVAVNVSQVVGSGLEDDGSNNIRIATSAFDQSTITGGGGSAAAVQTAPLVKRLLVAGESFAANTSFVVRFAIDGETVGRVYKADKDATTDQLYLAVGIALSTSAVSAGQSIPVTIMGQHNLGSSDTPFASADLGLEVFVGSSGSMILGADLAETTGEAAYCIGCVQETNVVWVDFKQLRGIA